MLSTPGRARHRPLGRLGNWQLPPRYPPANRASTGSHTMTRTTHLDPDNDGVTSSPLPQLAAVVGVTMVAMLLVIWRRR